MNSQQPSFAMQERQSLFQCCATYAHARVVTSFGTSTPNSSPFANPWRM